MIPNWAEDIHDLDSTVVRAQGRTTNIPEAGSTGEGVHVGIVDSTWQLSPTVTEGYDVIEDESNSFAGKTRNGATTHAREVFHRISSYCPDATFSLYQAADESGRMALGAYSDAITAAIGDGVDLLNVSAGDPWPAEIHTNPNVQETQRAVGDGITVVAAAGNQNAEPPAAKPPVHCPAALDPVIAVGAMQVVCPASIGSEPSEQVAGPYYCFTKDTEDVAGDSSDRGTYCTQRGCVAGKACLTNQSETEWGRNPLPTGGKPDVLAPMHAPQTDGDSFFYGKGTSFAAPIVTGSLACIFGELRDEGRDVPGPRSVREAVRSGSSRIDSGNESKYDAMGTRKALQLI